MPRLAVVSMALLALAGAVWAGSGTPAEEQLGFGADMARRGLWKEALFRFQQAARHDPDNSRILNNIAVAYEALGLFDEALETYRQALRVGPDDTELKGNYSRFIEFYQSFRPHEETAEAEPDEAGPPEAPSPSADEVGG